VSRACEPNGKHLNIGIAPSRVRTNSIAPPAQFGTERRATALDYFALQHAQVATQAALDVQVIGARRAEMVGNMSEGISADRVAPVEIIARRPLRAGCRC